MKRDIRTRDMIQDLTGHVSVEELHEIFKYQDGNLIHRKNGKIAGYVDPDKNGEVRIQLNGKKYYAYKLVWMLHFGYVNDGLEIRHKNGICGDNRIENLRLYNPAAKTGRKNNDKNALDGFVGVSVVGKRFRAKIRHNGKQISIGTFASPLEAHDAYLKYERVLKLGNAHEQ